jgi:hypothetical protein
MLILRNYTISNNKEKIISVTIEEGDDIVVVTFFAGDDNCCRLLQYKVLAFFAMLQGKNKLRKTKEEEGNDSCRRLFCGAAPL